MIKQLIKNKGLDILVLCETKLHEKHEQNYNLKIAGSYYKRFDKSLSTEQSSSTTIKKKNASGCLLVYFKGLVEAVVPACDYPDRPNRNCDCNKHKRQSTTNDQGHCDCHRYQYPGTNLQYLHIEIRKPISFHLVAIYSPYTNTNPRILEYETHRYKDPLEAMKYFIGGRFIDKQDMFIGDLNVDY